MFYLATFHPQVWVNDHAVSADPQGPTEWDATRFIQAMPASKRELLLEADTTDSDALRDDPAAPQWIRGWSGPFYVSVDEVESLPDGVYRAPPLRFRITVKPLVARKMMDAEDRRDYHDIVGDHDLEARDEEDALDRFHGRLAIACLDDFEITCAPLRDYRVIWSTDVPDAVSPEAAAREAFDALRDNLPTGATFEVVDHLSDARVSVSVDPKGARAAD